MGDNGVDSRSFAFLPFPYFSPFLCVSARELFSLPLRFSGVEAPRSYPVADATGSFCFPSAFAPSDYLVYIAESLCLLQPRPGRGPGRSLLIPEMARGCSLVQQVRYHRSNPDWA